MMCCSLEKGILIKADGNFTVVILYKLKNKEVEVTGNRMSVIWSSTTQMSSQQVVKQLK